VPHATPIKEDLTKTEREMDSIVINGLKTHYTMGGHGKTLICLHGGGPGVSAWNNYSNNFPTLSKFFRVLLVDLPGFGDSQTTIIRNERVRYYSGHLAQFMSELGIDSASIIGNALGGGVATKLAADRPSMVERLILIGPSSLGYDAIWSASPTEGIRSIRNFYKTPLDRERMRNFLRLFVYDEHIITDELVEDRFKRARDPAFIEFFQNLPPSEPLLEEIKRVRAPTLITWGADDRVTPVEHGFMLLKQMLNCELHVFARCGHWVMVEKAPQFDRLVLGFLRNDC